MLLEWNHKKIIDFVFGVLLKNLIVKFFGLLPSWIRSPFITPFLIGGLDYEVKILFRYRFSLY